MKLHEELAVATLASELGDVPHVSGLAIRLARKSGAGTRLTEWLMRVAVDRGASHYERPFDPALPRDNPAISTEEIGIALCLEQHPYQLNQLRTAAQLLSSPKTDAAHLCRLAVQERCEPVLLHIAASLISMLLSMNPGLLSDGFCSRALFRGRTPCPIGHAWSAIRQSHGKPAHIRPG
jgi:hypothetical protein